MNKYDDPKFFELYAQMERSKFGLKGAGEWPTLNPMIPRLKDKSILDLGCGCGWHCQYAFEQGATRIVGVDSSEKMLTVAKKQCDASIELVHESIENFQTNEAFDLVLSSLVFHYIEDFDVLIQKVSSFLNRDGVLIFTIEHPTFTAKGDQDWIYDEKGKIQHFPVDHYFEEGPRQAVFLGETMTKYHRTLTTMIQTLLKYHFDILDIQEPKPLGEMAKAMPDELRRPMMLIIKAKKGRPIQ